MEVRFRFAWKAFISYEFQTNYFKLWVFYSLFAENFELSAYSSSGQKGKQATFLELPFL